MPKRRCLKNIELKCFYVDFHGIFRKVDTKMSTNESESKVKVITSYVWKSEESSQDAQELNQLLKVTMILRVYSDRRCVCL